MTDKNFPNHVAIIPDGNRRWAKTRGLRPWLGHRAGSENILKNLEEILNIAREFGIRNFTFWIASHDNLSKRPPPEVDFLCKVFVDYFLRIADHPLVHKEGIRVRAYGHLEELFPEDVVNAVRTAEKKTARYNNLRVGFLMGYDGQVEMVEAVKKIVAEAITANPHPKPLTKELFMSHLWTADLPPVDLVIRTGSDGSPHWSGTLLPWQTAYSQLYFTDTLYPDFTPEEFRRAVKNFSHRERRFGR